MGSYGINIYSECVKRVLNSRLLKQNKPHTNNWNEINKNRISIL